MGEAIYTLECHPLARRLLMRRFRQLCQKYTANVKYIFIYISIVVVFAVGVSRRLAMHI